MFNFVKRYKELQAENKEQKSIISQLENDLTKMREEYDELNSDTNFKFVKGRKVLIIRIGDKEKGYIPSAHGQNVIRHNLKVSKIDETHNILVLPYYAGIEEIKGKK